MPYSIVFSDIDGTLLNSERELSVATISEIKRIKNTIPIVLISSRMPKAMAHLQRELDIANQPMVCYNGGLILIDNKPIHSTFIAPELIDRILDFNKEEKVHLSLYHDNEWYVPKMDFWATREANNTKVDPIVKPTHKVVQDWKIEKKGAHKIMCMGEEGDIDTIFDFLKTNYSDQLHLYRSKPTYIEVAHKSISKLTAIDILLTKHYNIPINEAVAFGDNYNDISMLKAVGYGIAVQNAKEEVLEIADSITESSKTDGVAKYIKNHIL